MWYKRHIFELYILYLKPLLLPNYKTTNLRIGILILFFIIGFLTIITRAYNVVYNSLDEDINFDKLAQDSSSFHRANIYDRNGKLLAVDLSVASVYANPKKIFDVKETVQKLKHIFPDLNTKNLLKEFNSHKSFVWIKRNATPKELYAVNRLGLPGIQYESGHRRFYPYGNLLSHIVGYTGIDGMGLSGVEKYFDNKLIINPKNKEQDQNGLSLSVDLRIQYILHEELNKAVQEFKPLGAAGIVTDIKTGEILALVSLPDFDPHNPGKANNDQLFNRATLASQELGSVFKTITMAMALDSKKITLASSYDVNEPIKFARYKLKDYHGKGGIQTVTEIFMNSSNIGTAKIAVDLGIETQKEYIKKFGLIDNINLELPEKGQAIYPSDSKWSILSTMTISYGHGIMTTPIHFLRTFTGLVNDGQMYPLTIVKDGNKDVKPKTIVSKETADNLKRLLRLSVTDGSGKKANADGYLVGGKTGSAEKSIRGGYSKTANLSSFIAAFPINEPKYSVFILLDEPKGNKSTFGYSTGGWTATPVAGRVISRIGSVLGISPIDENDPKIAKKLWVQYYDDEKLNAPF
ncbi:MAG: penicillin-binding protein 2 [Sphingobacteriia bacterium]|nr:penicillin-binding protein 2 [Sphingobacteriia bacterium]